MAINYKAKDALNAFQAGEYDGVILAVEETTSKNSGNDMYKITWEVYGENRKANLFDYIVVPNALFRLKQLAQALGKLAEFNAETFDPAKYVNRRLRLKLDLTEDAQYGDKNSVKQYLAPPAATPTTNGTAKPAGTIAGTLRERSAATADAAPPYVESGAVAEEDIPF